MKVKFFIAKALKAKFLKNFDTFAAMDSFFRINLGPASFKTQVIKGQLVQYKIEFKAQVGKETQIMVSGYDQDLTEDEFCGEGKIKLSQFELSKTVKGNLFIGKEKTCEFQMTGEFVIQTISKPVNKEITFFNIQARLNESKELFGDGIDPYVKATLNKVSKSTQVVQAITSSVANFREIIVLPSAQGDILFQVFDKDVFYDGTIGNCKINSSQLGNQGVLQLQLLNEKKMSQGVLRFNYTRNEFNWQQQAKKQKAQQEQKIRRAKEKQQQQKRLLDAKIEAQKKKATQEALKSAVQLRSDICLYQYQCSVSIPQTIASDFSTELKIKSGQVVQAMAIQSTGKPAWKHSQIYFNQAKAGSFLKFSVVYYNFNGSKVYESSETAIELFDSSKNQIQIPLSNQGKKSGHLKIKFSKGTPDKAAIQADIDKLNKAVQTNKQTAPLPQVLYLYNMRSDMPDDHPCYQSQGMFKLTGTCGKQINSSQMRPGDELSIAWKCIHKINPKQRYVTFSISNTNGKVNLNQKLDLKQLEKASGVKRLVFKQGGNPIADLVFNFSKQKSFPFDTEIKELKSVKQNQQKLPKLIVKNVSFTSKDPVKKPLYAVICVGQQAKRTQTIQSAPYNYKKQSLFTLNGQKNLLVKIIGDKQAEASFKIGSFAEKDEDSLVFQQKDPSGNILFTTKLDFSIKNRPKAQMKPSNSLNLSPEKKQIINSINSQQNKKQITRQSRLSKVLKPIIPKYGDKIYQKQSASTLQNSICAFSFSKDQRFKSKIQNSQPSYYVSNSIAKPKYQVTNFGYGGRKPYPQWMERNMKQNPAPGAYSLQPIKSLQKKGVSFGMSHKVYEKVLCKLQVSKKQKQQIRKIPKDRERAQSYKIRPAVEGGNFHYNILPRL